MTRKKMKKSDWTSTKAGTFRVLDSMYIYLITNLVNGKQYVGKTERKDPRQRWNEHKKDSRRSPKTVISRAIRKYGIDSFRFEIIETHTDPGLLAIRESHWIHHYNTLSPKGYNVEVYQPHVILSAASRAKRSRMNQGKTKSRSKSSSYLGVTKREKRWVMEIGKDHKSYSQSYPNELEAAQSYDAMALRLYGPSARTNFDPSSYTPEMIDSFYNNVITSDKTSIHRGVDFVTSRGKWRTVVRLLNGKTWCLYSLTEEEAAEAYDKAKIHLLGAVSEDLNFPERYQSYLSQDLAIFCYREPKSSQYWGVCYRKKNGTYRARFKYLGKAYHCGDYETELQAHNAVQSKLNQLKVSNGNRTPQN